MTTVINDDGVGEPAAAFPTHVRLQNAAADVPGSPQPGSTAGTNFVVPANEITPYQVYEQSNDLMALHYTAKFGGACTSAGLIVLRVGEHKTCTVTNDDIKAPTEEIEGDWLLTTPFLGMWQLHVTQGPPYTFNGTVTSSSCASYVGQSLLTGVRGKDNSYTGQFRLISGDKCTPDPPYATYAATVTLSGDHNSGQICAQTSPSTQSCQAISRVSP